MNVVGQQPHGLYPGLTNFEYHTGPGVSNSDLKYIRKSPRHYWAKRISAEGIQEKNTRAKELGTNAHCALLEPDVFASNYAIIPEDAPRKPTTAQWNAKNPSHESMMAMDWWRKFNEDSAKKVIIKKSDYELCQNIADAVRNHPVAGDLFDAGFAEQSYYATDEDSGLLIRCRPDFVNTRMNAIIDLKKVQDASPDAFGRSCVSYGYYVQAPFYLDIFRRLGQPIPWFIFVAVEEDFPHAVGVYFVSPDQIEIGRERYQRELMKIADCMRKDYWPDYCEEIEQLQLPGWFKG